jgi:hypothetical protein
MARGNRHAATVRLPRLSWSPDAYKKFMNPYEKDGHHTSLENSSRGDEPGPERRLGAGQRQPRPSAVPARGALSRRHKSTEDYGRRRDLMVAQLRSQGFSEANATRRMANTQLQQQTNLANAGFEQQARKHQHGQPSSRLSPSTC